MKVLLDGPEPLILLDKRLLPLCPLFLAAGWHLVHITDHKSLSSLIGSYNDTALGTRQAFSNILTHLHLDPRLLLGGTVAAICAQTGQYCPLRLTHTYISQAQSSV